MIRARESLVTEVRSMEKEKNLDGKNIFTFFRKMPFAALKIPQRRARR